MLNDIKRDDMTTIVGVVYQKVSEGIMNSFSFCESEGLPLNDLQKIQVLAAIFGSMAEVTDDIAVQAQGQARFKDFFREVTQEDLDKLLGGVIGPVNQ